VGILVGHKLKPSVIIKYKDNVINLIKNKKKEKKMIGYLLSFAVGFGVCFFLDDIKKEVNKFMAMRKRLKEDE